MKVLTTLIGLWVIAAAPLNAATPQQVQQLAQVIGLPDIIEITREEGLDYAEGIADQMFPGRTTGWQTIIDRIYDAEWMATVITQNLQDELASTDIAPLIDYFTSDIGRQVITLEVSARTAMMEEAVEDASKERVAEMSDDGDPRLDLIADYILANDLVENNVVGTMNSNLAFYTGLSEGGAFDETMTQDQILIDVWAQEEDIRLDTGQWLYAFLTMAYQPLSDAELTAYTELSKTTAGQDLNKALFVAFDAMFEEVSRALGKSAALMMTGEDL